jgi:hypothetical protein
MTHLPVLLALRLLRPVKRVLELGAGEYSTLAFLDRQCFPELERLVSFENDSQWAERVQQMAQGDNRLCLKLKSGLMAKAVAEEKLHQYDTIFLDDSRCVAERCQTIQTVAAMRPEQAVIVIHDFEVLDYREAALPFRRTYRFSGINPSVGVAWNGNQLSKRHLKPLNARLRELPLEAYPSDPRGWMAWLSRGPGQGI